MTFLIIGITIGGVLLTTLAFLLGILLHRVYTKYSSACCHRQVPQQQSSDSETYYSDNIVYNPQVLSSLHDPGQHSESEPYYSEIPLKPYAISQPSNQQESTETESDNTAIPLNQRAISESSETPAFPFSSATTNTRNPNRMMGCTEVVTFKNE